MKEIRINHQDEMRYNTLGDYQEKNGVVYFSVKKTDDEDKDFTVAVHELIEWYLTQKRGISEHEIDKWDFDHESEYDPGDDPLCPYHKEHRFASLIEQSVLHELNKDL